MAKGREREKQRNKEYEEQQDQYSQLKEKAWPRRDTDRDHAAIADSTICRLV